MAARWDQSASPETAHGAMDRFTEEDGFEDAQRQVVETLQGDDLCDDERWVPDLRHAWAHAWGRTQDVNIRAQKQRTNAPPIRKS